MDDSERSYSHRHAFLSILRHICRPQVVRRPSDDSANGRRVLSCSPGPSSSTLQNEHLTIRILGMSETVSKFRDARKIPPIQRSRPVERTGDGLGGVSALRSSALSSNCVLRPSPALTTPQEQQLLPLHPIRHLTMAEKYTQAELPYALDVSPLVTSPARYSADPRPKS